MQMKRKKHFLSTLLILLVLVAVILTPQALVLSQVIPPDEIKQISWSPDGNYIAVAGGSSGCNPEKKATEYAVRIVDTATGEIVNYLVGHNCRLVAVDWSPDGSRIASSSFDGLSLIWDVQAGNSIQYLKVRPEIGLGVVWSPNSMMIASVGSGGNYAMIWSASTGEYLFDLPTSHTAPTTSVVWNPNGMQIATSALDNTIRTWDVASQQVLLTIQASSQIYWVDWHPDGTRLMGANRDGTIQIWDAISGQVLDTLIGHTDSVDVVFWSPDGTLIASGSKDGTIRIWDAATGQPVDIIQSAVGTIVDIAWNPTGNQIAFIGESSGNQNNLVEITNIQSITCSFTIPATDTPTLLAAITSANTTPEADTICLEAGTYTLTTPNNSGSDGPNGLPVITSDITLHGLGAGATILRDSAAPAFRILKVDTGARLVLENITISGGDAGSGSGGGIRNLGTLELRNSVVENNLPDDLSGEGAIIQAER